jgi:hypothetical protein
MAPRLHLIDFGIVRFTTIQIVRSIFPRQRAKYNRGRGVTEYICPSRVFKELLEMRWVIIIGREKGAGREDIEYLVGSSSL